MISTGAACVLLLAVGALIAIAVAAIRLRRVDPLAAVRRRLLLSVDAVLLLLVAVVPLNSAAAQLEGLPFVMAPATAAVVALLVFGAVPWRPPRWSGPRAASIRPRSARRVAGPWNAVLLGAPLGVLVALLVVCGVLGDPDGRSLTVRRPHLEATTGFPGWFFGAPLLVAVAVLVLATAIAVRRAAVLPAIHLDQTRDLLWRRSAVRAIVLVADVALLLELAWTTWAVRGALLHAGGGIVGAVPPDAILTALVPVFAATAQLSGLLAAIVFVAATAQAASVSRARPAASVPG